ncbi:MAG: 50S ribosomal protein L9 [Elusimicrobia bacterium]|nr:50S ribosomal protein L9 [Elusimicrobiota bacterium]
MCDDLSKVGLAGEVKVVSDGYARNFLLPRKLALIATAPNLKRWESEKHVRQIKGEHDLSSAKEVAARLETIVVDVEALGGREGHLFGSITSQTIAESLLEKGISLDKKSIVLEKPIKSLGEYQVTVRLHPQVNALLKVNVRSKAS